MSLGKTIMLKCDPEEHVQKVIVLLDKDVRGGKGIERNVETH
ncbi:MAG: hypothetical protein ACE5R6_16100 [Candidatus Heimdallarchaeota archaeon]